ncbi:MAG: hypothetical protein AB7P18_32405 [Candidatus Binatia bacterium]
MSFLACEADFVPLATLARDATTELYLGLVHAQDSTAGTLRRMQAARKTVTDVGITTACGSGRSWTPAMGREILRVHSEVARQAG